MANPTTVEGLLSAVENHGANHRDSLSTPVSPRTTGGAHIAFSPGHTPQPRYNRNLSFSGGQYSVYGVFPHPRPVPWLNKLCHEPEGDVGTCCLGYWLPCALYGNTQYRLKQMAQGDDPLDLSEHKHNNEPCWMHQMLCFFFRCEWCVVMLQHSRIRATYNIDGTAGGDCVQSYYCPCCTLMQDEREVVARENRILREKKGDGDVTEQPGFQPQMRYSTSNLLEEIPEVFREHAGSYPSSVHGSTQALMSEQGSARESRRHSLEGRGRDGWQGHEMDDLQPFSIGHSDSDMAGVDEHRRMSRSRRSSSGPAKLRLRETSPFGSALNPITVSRSVSVDHGLQKPKQQPDVPQRSVTSPTRRRSSKDTNPPPANRNINYRLKSITTDDRPDFLIETIKEGSESSNHAPTIDSRKAVKSLAMDSLRSGASKNNTFSGHKKKASLSESHDDLRTDEAYTTFYNDQGKMVRRRISECLRPRASTPETLDMYQFHHANPNDDEKTVELKKALAEQAKAEKQETKDRKRLKLKLPPAGDIASSTQSLKSPTIPMTTPAIAEALPPGSLVVVDRGGTKPEDKSISIVVTTVTEKSGGSDILSLPEGVNDTDDLALYRYQAVQDSGLKIKNQKSIDRSAMPDMPIGAMAPPKQPPRLDFNSEDSGSDTALTSEQIAYGRNDKNTDMKERVSFSRVSPQTIPDSQFGTRVAAVDRYPSYIVTSDGATASTLETQAETPVDSKMKDRRCLDNVVKEFGHMTPRHKKSVSDWFKDIGRSNSNKSEKDFNVKIHQDEVPPIPVLPAQFKEQGYSLGPPRSFSPLGIKGLNIMGREKSKGKSQFSTMRAAQRLAPMGKESRTVSAPPVPAVPSMFSTQPLGDATNNAVIAENMMETAEKLQVLEDEFKFMAEEVAYEINNQSPTPAPDATGESWGGGWSSPGSSTIAITTSSKDKDPESPIKLKQRSFPLIKSNSSTPTSSLSTATARTFLVLSGAIDIDHSRHGADTGNANIYNKKALVSPIKEISSTPVYGTDTPTTLESLALPTNLESPSAFPKGFLEHMPGEFPITSSPETPAAPDEVVVEQMSPARYFPMIGTRTSSLKVETFEDVTSQSTSNVGSAGSDHSAKSGHVHEDQQIEVANQFDSSSAAARVMSGTLEGGKESDPFSHPFFSGTAVIDFGLMSPKIRQKLRMSEDMGSEETIRSEREVNPLGVGVDGCMGSAEENPLQATDSTSTSMDSGSILRTESVRREAMPALTPIAEASREVSVTTMPEILRGDDITSLLPPPDHPVTAERMDDAIAAIMANPRASSVHGALTKPLMVADELGSVCDQMNRGALSYESEEEIITVGPNGPMTPTSQRVKSRKEEKSAHGLKHTSTVVWRSMSPERPPMGVSPGNSRMQAALEAEVGGTPKIIVGDETDRLVVDGRGSISTRYCNTFHALASRERVQSPAETKLREMLGKVTGKDISPGHDKIEDVEHRDIDMKGDTIVGEKAKGGLSGGVKKKKSLNSPQRRRNMAEKKRREREEAKQPNEEIS